MKKTIFCLKKNDNEQTYHLSYNGKTYYLFTTRYKSINREIYKNGLDFEEVYGLTNDSHEAISSTAYKIIKTVKYIESEYGLTLTKKTNNTTKPKQIYNRTKSKQIFITRLNEYYQDIAI